jgi:hypothetical protein
VEVAVTSEMLAKIEAQRAYFASDDHIRERAAIWRDASPEACLETVSGLCDDAAYFLSLKDPETLARVLEPPPIPDDTIAILEALQLRSRP